MDNKLVDKLIKLLDPGKAELIDFDQLTGTYSKKKVDAISIQLDELEKAGYIQFNREDYGFRINLYDIDKLKNSQVVSATRKHTDLSISN